MARIETVNASSIMALEGAPLNADYLINVKAKLADMDADETPDNVREAAAALRYEAQELVASSRTLRARSAELRKQAREQADRAEAITNTPADTIARRMGI